MKTNITTCKIIIMILAVAISLFTSCSSSDDSTRPTTQTWHNHFVINRDTEATAAYGSSSRVQINFVVTNIPTDMAAEGDSLAITGYNLCDSTGTEYSWKVGASETSTEFVKTVTSSSVTFTFFWNTTFNTTDFKVFKAGDWDSPIVIDPEESNGNIDIAFDSGLAKAGDVLTITVDASTLQ